MAGRADGDELTEAEERAIEHILDAVEGIWRRESRQQQTEAA